MTWTLMAPPGPFCSQKLTLFSSTRIKSILKLVKKPVSNIYHSSSGNATLNLNKLGKFSKKSISVGYSLGPHFLKAGVNLDSNSLTLTLTGRY